MKLEKSLILNKYLLSLFGFEKINDLFKRLSTVREGFDSDGKSNYASELILLEGMKISNKRKSKAIVSWHGLLLEKKVHEAIHIGCEQIASRQIENKKGK